MSETKIPTAFELFCGLTLLALWYFVPMFLVVRSFAMMLDETTPIILKPILCAISLIVPIVWIGRDWVFRYYAGSL